MHRDKVGRITRTCTARKRVNAEATGDPKGSSRGIGVLSRPVPWVGRPMPSLGA